MTGFPGLTAKERPTAVPIHIDRDMKPIPASTFRLFGILPTRIQIAWCHLRDSAGWALGSLQRSVSMM